MPTSFEALHEETRPLALLDEGRATRPAGWRQQVTITRAGLTVVLVVLLVLLVLL